MASASPLASSSAQAVLTLIFGLTATVLSIAAVWQGYRFWNTWSKRPHQEDLEANHIIRYELDANAFDLVFPQQDVVEDDLPCQAKSPGVIAIPSSTSSGAIERDEAQSSETDCGDCPTTNNLANAVDQDLMTPAVMPISNVNEPWLARNNGGAYADRSLN